MNELEVLDMLDEAATVPERREEIWDQLQAEARGNADQLTLPDKVKLDGILEVMGHIYLQVSQYMPSVLPAYAPIIHAVCSDRRTTQLFDKDHDWATLTPRVIGHCREETETWSRIPPGWRELSSPR